MGNALAEQLLAVRPEEPHQGRETDEPLLVVVVHLDDEVAVAHPRSVVADLDLDIGDSGFVQSAARRLCYRCRESRAHSGAALPPRVDLEDLAALDHGEACLATYERRQLAGPPRTASTNDCGGASHRGPRLTLRWPFTGAVCLRRLECIGFARVRRRQLDSYSKRFDIEALRSYQEDMRESRTLLGRL